MADTKLKVPDNLSLALRIGDNIKIDKKIIKLGRGSGSVFTSINYQSPTTRNFINNLPMGICKLSYEVKTS